MRRSEKRTWNMQTLLQYYVFECHLIPFCKGMANTNKNMLYSHAVLKLSLYLRDFGDFPVCSFNQKFFTYSCSKVSVQGLNIMCMILKMTNKAIRCMQPYDFTSDIKSRKSGMLWLYVVWKCEFEIKFVYDSNVRNPKNNVIFWKDDRITLLMSRGVCDSDERNENYIIKILFILQWMWIEILPLSFFLSFNLWINRVSHY